MKISTPLARALRYAHSFLAGTQDIASLGYSITGGLFMRHRQGGGA